MIKKGFWIFIEEIGVERAEAMKLLEEGKKIVSYEKNELEGDDYWQISEDEVRTMYSIVRLTKPLTVIETGMGPGVSTTTILYATDTSSRIFSIDPGLPYGKGDREVGFVIPKEMRKRLNFVKGTSKEKLMEVLDLVGNVDMFFHDSEHSYENIMFELNAVWPRLKRSSLILIDNYDWTDAPRDFAEIKRMKLQNISDDLAVLYSIL